MEKKITNNAQQMQRSPWWTSCLHPYAKPNVTMANYTTYYDKNVMHLFIKCYSHKNKAQNVAYIMYQSPSYITTVMVHGVGVWHSLMAQNITARSILHGQTL